jgi:hypothetical protein
MKRKQEREDDDEKGRKRVRFSEDHIPQAAAAPIDRQQRAADKEEEMEGIEERGEGRGRRGGRGAVFSRFNPNVDGLFDDNDVADPTLIDEREEERDQEAMKANRFVIFFHHLLLSISKELFLSSSLTNVSVLFSLPLLNKTLLSSPHAAGCSVGRTSTKWSRSI